MEENEGTQVCPNCNREIPKVNFVIHSVHCVRNIKICPVCKEPIPQSELEDHNDRLHMLVPCKQCGEMVRGTDMEDHTRDSCAFTMQSCRFCSLELRRREVPAHERYCGARTERCADCGEYVMVRYRQLHLESNHGFVRLDDDPPPRLVGAVGDAIPNRPPINRRPRFPPYVPLADIIRPSVSEEESLRMIAQCRAMQTEPDEFPNMTNEELRQKMIASVPPLQPERNVEDRPNDDVGPRTYRDRQKQALIANLRGRVGARLSFVQNPVDEVARDARGRDVARNIRGLEAVAREARVRDVARRGAMLRDLGPYRADRRNAAAQNETARNADTRDPDVRNAQAQDAVPPVAVEQNAGAQGAVVKEATANESKPQEVDLRETLAAELLSGEVEAEEEEEVVEASRPRPPTGSRPRSNYRVILKRTNDQPQINTTVVAQDKVQKKLGARGAVKKRPAPAAPAGAASVASAPPPLGMPPPDPRRDLPYYSALQRRQDEDSRRNEQNAYNLSVGLPPVLDPAAKLEKLRKMDALHNRETDNHEYRHRLQGRVWQNNNVPPAGRTLGHAPDVLLSAVLQNGDMEQQRRQLEDLQPMSAEEFMERFNQLQLLKEPSGGVDNARGRFGDIRSSLQELRRGLNEVTAPYNNSANNNNNNTNHNNNLEESSLINDILNGTSDTNQLDEARAAGAVGQSPEADVMVPCEFCFKPLRATQILDHERVCRHNTLTGQGLTASSTPPIASTRSSRPLSPWDEDNIPVIPCEFCAATLPFYLINEHQALCGRGSQLLYPD